MFKSTVKICWQELQLTPTASEISSIVYRWSSLIFCQIFPTFSSVWLVEGRPEWGWSSTLISPCLNRANHLNLCTAQCFLLKGRLKYFMCFCGCFSKMEKNLKQIHCSVQSDIMISRKELDNTWENWQHKPIQPSTVMSAWLLTHEGCNYTHLAREHSTTIRTSSPKPVRFFLGPPLYYKEKHRSFSSC